jgi:hypothetical protein
LTDTVADEGDFENQFWLWLIYCFPSGNIVPHSKIQFLLLICRHLP